MPAWVKKAAQYVLFLGIGLALLYLTFKNVNPVDLWDNLKAVSVEGLIGIIAIGFLAIIFRGLRWVQMLQSLGYEVHGARAIAAVAFSYLVNLVTPRVGEVARCTALNRTDKVPIDKLVGTVVLERVVDTLLFLVVVLSTVIISSDELRDFMIQSGAQLPELSATALVLAGILLGGGYCWCISLVTHGCSGALHKKLQDLPPVWRKVFAACARSITSRCFGFILSVFGPVMWRPSP